MSSQASLPLVQAKTDSSVSDSRPPGSTHFRDLAHTALAWLLNFSKTIQGPANISTHDREFQTVANIYYDKSMRACTGEDGSTSSTPSSPNVLLDTSGPFMAATPIAWLPDQTRKQSDQPPLKDLWYSLKPNGLRKRLLFEQRTGGPHRPPEKPYAFLRCPRTPNSKFTQITDQLFVEAMGRMSVCKVVLDVEELYFQNGLTLPATTDPRSVEITPDQPLQMLLMAFDIFYLEFAPHTGMCAAFRTPEDTQRLNVSQPEHYLYDKPLDERLSYLQTFCDTVNFHLRQLIQERTQAARRRVCAFRQVTVDTALDTLQALSSSEKHPTLVEAATHLVFKPVKRFSESDLAASKQSSSPLWSPMKTVFADSWHLLPRWADSGGLDPDVEDIEPLGDKALGWFGEPALEFMERRDRAVAQLAAAKRKKTTEIPGVVEVLADDDDDFVDMDADGNPVKDQAREAEKRAHSCVYAHQPRFVAELRLPVPRGGGPETVLVEHDGATLRNGGAVGRDGSGWVPPQHKNLCAQLPDQASVRWAEVKIKFFHTSDLMVSAVDKNQGTLTLTLVSTAPRGAPTEANVPSGFHLEQSYVISHPTAKNNTRQEWRLAQRIKPGSIVECTWDAVKHVWRPVALRLDKQTPNFCKVVHHTKLVAQAQAQIGFRNFGAGAFAIDSRPRHRTSMVRSPLPPSTLKCNRLEPRKYPPAKSLNATWIKPQPRRLTSTAPPSRKRCNPRNAGSSATLTKRAKPATSETEDMHLDKALKILKNSMAGFGRPENQSSSSTLPPGLPESEKIQQLFAHLHTKT